MVCLRSLGPWCQWVLPLGVLLRTEERGKDVGGKSLTFQVEKRNADFTKAISGSNSESPTGFVIGSFPHTGSKNHSGWFLMNCYCYFFNPKQNDFL